MCHSSHYRFGTHPALWIEDLVNVCVSIRLPCDGIGLFFSGGFPIPFSTCALKTGKVGPGLCKNGCGKKVAQGLPERKQRLGTTDAINQLEKVLQKMTPKNSKSTIRGSGRLISWKPMALWRFNCFNFRGVTWILAGSYGVNFIARNPLVAWFTLGIILPGWKEGITIMQNYAVLLCMFISMMGIPVLEMGSFFVAKNVAGFSMGSLDPVRTWQVASKSYLHVMCLRT